MIRFAWLAMLLRLATPAAAQNPPADSTAGEIRIYLVTFDTGAEVWERFGHNAIWVHDPASRTDLAYDYGRFSFQSERFFSRFAKGDLRYWMGQADVRALVGVYQAAHRSVWIQELDLPLVARTQLRDFLRWNIREENKYYQYNYYTDNCSTRLRDAIDRVLGGQLGRWAKGVSTPWTYRDHTRRLTENSPLFHSALDLGLGQPVDQRLSVWEEMFLPISLRPWIDSLTVTDPDGRSHRLVKSEQHVAISDKFPVPAAPHDWTWRYLLAGTAIGAVLAGLGRLARTSSRSRLAFGIGATTWAAAAGLLGLGLAALWAFTTHRFSYRNENLLQTSVLSLLVAFALPRALWGPPSRRRWALLTAGIVAAVALGGLLVKLFPPFYQSNLDIIALVAPIHLGLLAGLVAAGPRVG